MDAIINRVAESGLVTLDLAPYVTLEDALVFDLKPFLFREMILKEKDYRTALMALDWTVYDGHDVCILCSVDAIIPAWAFMLAASGLAPVARSVYFGTPQELKKSRVLDSIATIDTGEYADKRIVIKGCGEVDIPEYAYVAITALLRPVAKTIMYGEPCSTVPIYKKK